MARDATFAAGASRAMRAPTLILAQNALRVQVSGPAGDRILPQNE